MVTTIKFKPKQATKRLTAVLPVRTKDVIVSRFGLGKKSESMTLESIGKKYGITRERVRQIENYALNNIRKSDAYTKEKETFDELESILYELGAIVAEDDFLNIVAPDEESLKSHVNFLMVLGHKFTYKKEDEHFKHRWHIDQDDISDKVHETLKNIYKNLSNDDLIQEPDIIASFLENIKDLADKYKNDEIIKRWLGISKKIGKNPLGEWGLSDSPNIKAKGMKDYAFLVLRKHGSPIHFSQVAKSISELFGKKAHMATCHNELIKDPRFVLVGRGLYALSEWGYLSGVVKDVIKKLIEKNGPMTKREIMDKVLKERYVKENTVAINLQNSKFFKKDKEGKYSIV